jgi:hypothetical protein
MVPKDSQNGTNEVLFKLRLIVVLQDPGLALIKLFDRPEGIIGVGFPSLRAIPDQLPQIVVGE